LRPPKLLGGARVAMRQKHFAFEKDISARVPPGGSGQIVTDFFRVCPGQLPFHCA